MEWLTSDDAQNMEVDIGFVPQMELVYKHKADTGYHKCCKYYDTKTMAFPY